MTDELMGNALLAGAITLAGEQSATASPVRNSSKVWRGSQKPRTDFHALRDHRHLRRGDVLHQRRLHGTVRLRHTRLIDGSRDWPASAVLSANVATMNT